MTKLANALSNVREPTPYEKFRSRLEQMRPEFAALAGEKGVERFLRVVCNAVQGNPKLLDADARSLLLSCLKAAQDGLLPDGREAVLNIFNTKEKIGDEERWINKVQYMPMVGGLIKKLYASGVRLVDAVAVNKMDRFEYQRGDDPKIVHIPYDGDEEPGPVVAAYVRVILDNSEVKREVMFRRDIEKAHKAGNAYKSAARWNKEETGPWIDWYDQMAIKTVLHRVYKQLPSSVDVDTVFDADDEAMGFKAGADLDKVLLPSTAAAGGTAPPITSTAKREPEPATQNAGAAGGQQQAAKEPESQQEGGPPKLTYAVLEEKIRKATDVDLLDAHADLIKTLDDETQQAELHNLYSERRVELTNKTGKKK